MNELPTDPKSGEGVQSPCRPRAQIVIENLPPREDGPRERVLPKLLAIQGDSCYQNCDCAFGLICREGVCESDW